MNGRVKDGKRGCGEWKGRGRGREERVPPPIGDSGSGSGGRKEGRRTRRGAWVGASMHFFFQDCISIKTTEFLTISLSEFDRDY